MFERTKGRKEKKNYLNSFLFIPIWSLPFPTRSNTSMKTLNHNKNQKIILIFYIKTELTVGTVLLTKKKRLDQIMQVNTNSSQNA
jgi:hypothetical protein